MLACGFGAILAAPPLKAAGSSRRVRTSLVAGDAGQQRRLRSDKLHQRRSLRGRGRGRARGCGGCPATRRLTVAVRVGSLQRSGRLAQVQAMFRNRGATQQGRSY